jgi:hypothetical protein
MESQTIGVTLNSTHRSTEAGFSLSYLGTKFFTGVQMYFLTLV